MTQNKIGLAAGWVISMAALAFSLAMLIGGVFRTYNSVDENAGLDFTLSVTFFIGFAVVAVVCNPLVFSRLPFFKGFWGRFMIAAGCIIAGNLVGGALSTPIFETYTPLGHQNRGISYRDGNGAPKDHKRAAEQFQIAADMGVATSQSEIGSMYYSGDGVTENHALAAKYYEMAASHVTDTSEKTDKALLPTVFNIGNMYKEGDGVSQNYGKAILYFQLAADKGNQDAQLALGVMYASGKGVSKDYVKAKELWQKAADQGNATAQNNIGVLYENGWGVTKDQTKANEWYQKAKDSGYKG